MCTRRRVCVVVEVLVVVEGLHRENVIKKQCFQRTAAAATFFFSIQSFVALIQLSNGSIYSPPPSLFLRESTADLVADLALLRTTSLPFYSEAMKCYRILLLSRPLDAAAA
jgi:hypothetical protein